MDEIAANIHKIIADVLGLRHAKGQTIVRKEVMEWDSLNHMQIVFMIEHTYRVRFSINEITAINSEEDLTSSVYKKLTAS
jgi:acyl carrier protein